MTTRIPPPAGSTAALLAFALDAWQATPALRIDDAYKWLVQATRGAEHAVSSADAAASWLRREWAALEPPRPHEPLVEPLRPDGALVRLHLRPYRAGGGSAQALLDAFLAGAAVPVGDASAFTAAWQALRTHLARQPSEHLTPQAWQALDEVMQPKAYPAIHHSEAYAQACAPAYRVLRGEYADALLGNVRPWTVDR